MLQHSPDPAGNIALLGRSDMAAIIGTSVETASRIIAEMKRHHLLEKIFANL